MTKNTTAAQLVSKEPVGAKTRFNIPTPKKSCNTTRKLVKLQFTNITTCCITTNVKMKMKMKMKGAIFLRWRFFRGCWERKAGPALVKH